MTDRSETTPLLIDASAGASTANEQNDVISYRQTPGRPFCGTFYLTWLSIIISVLTFTFLFAAVIINQYPSSQYKLDWRVEDGCVMMIELSVAAAFLSFLNLAYIYFRQRPMWLFLNLAIDAFVSGYSFVIDIQGLLLNSKPCQPGPRCGEISKRTRMFAGIGLSFGLALGFIHLTLFLIRCTIAIRSRSEHELPRSFRAPNGDLRLEFTIRLLGNNTPPVSIPPG
ncbi:hypothetical protein PAAG_03998 [Paracoccidioides lutzii Pb01]|uniref:MARVEL domain-containing protein n=1 Tax=Paracoccidioides lutzii (strain ATCC MYA-826 / Pb01) TaxID=502779 RepID=C1GZQ4_PARBA|nr:hypothetical protein PAAG_03998 [Paracoccidioides lutzii Pb01]EEH42077.2 hypothetical protein PAAG_03998 [Paracoccidioides lutzii Pb01]